MRGIRIRPGGPLLRPSAHVLARCRWSTNCPGPPTANSIAPNSLPHTMIDASQSATKAFRIPDSSSSARAPICSAILCA